MPRAGLDRQTLIDAAIVLADRDGFESLTLRALAKRFRVAPPSLYNHVQNLDALRRELQLEGLRRLTERFAHAAAGKASGDAVRALAAVWRGFAAEHPGLYAATVRAPGPKDVELRAEASRLLGIINAVLAGFGLTDSAAVHAARALRSALHGFISLEASGGFGLPEERDESYRRLVELVITGLPSINAKAAE